MDVAVILLGPCLSVHHIVCSAVPVYGTAISWIVLSVTWILISIIVFVFTIIINPFEHYNVLKLELGSINFDPSTSSAFEENDSNYQYF